MDELKKYKKYCKRLFFVSINKDSKHWNNNSDVYLTSQYYDSPDKNVMASSRFKVSLKTKELFIETKHGPDIFICRYGYFYFIYNYKIYFYINKLKKSMKIYDKNLKNEQEIKRLKNCLNVIEKNYISETRKEKLLKLK